MIDMTIDMQATVPPYHSHFDGNGNCDATREANHRADRMSYRAAAANRAGANGGMNSGMNNGVNNGMNSGMSNGMSNGMNSGMNGEMAGETNGGAQAQSAQMMPYGGAQAMTPYAGANGEEYGTDYAWSASAEEGMSSIPQDSFNEPLSAGEAARNSWRALLARNVGRNVLVRFLMGTQNFVTVEGELYEVGTDYIVIYQPLWDSHITADLYSVKFVEFREPPGQPLG